MRRRLTTSHNIQSCQLVTAIHPSTRYDGLTDRFQSGIIDPWAGLGDGQMADCGRCLARRLCMAAYVWFLYIFVVEALRSTPDRERAYPERYVNRPQSALVEAYRRSYIQPRSGSRGV